MQRVSEARSLERINDVCMALLLLSTAKDDEPGYRLVCRLLSDELAEAASALPGNDPVQ